MIELEAETIEVEVTNNIEVTSAGQVEVEPIDLNDLDITVAKKEYVITGDDIYIPMLYDDAPQWMKDLVQVVVDVSISSGNQSLINDMNAIIQDFAVSYVPLNQYTQSILELGDEDTRINGLITTLNSNFNDGLSNSNAQIAELQLTKAGKDEVVAQIIQTISAQLADTNSSIGATVGRIDQAIANETSARANSFTTVMASISDIELDITANADATQVLNAYVGVDPTGGLTGAGLLANVELIQAQLDGVIETVTGEYDVITYTVVDGEIDPTSVSLVITAEPYATWIAAEATGSISERSKHIGDVYLKYVIDPISGIRGYDSSYKFIKTVIDGTTPYGTDADGFTWAKILDQLSAEVYATALNALDLADNKRRVFVSTPVVPYDIGDLWLVQTGAGIIGTTQGGRVIQVGDMLRCAEDKGSTATYEHNDWIPADSYREGMNAIQTDLNSWRTGTYAPFVTSIQSQVDGKAETFYQNSVPTGRIKSTNVANNTTLNKYVGDLWKNTYAGTISGYLGDNTEYIYTKIANGSNWNYDWTKMEVPDIVFDTIDTKKSIYSGNSIPVAVAPDVIEVNDMWITGFNVVSGYDKESIYIWSGSAWVKPLKYTDDQYARDIVDGATQIDLSQHINSLGWTDDSVVDDFIVSTYAKDLLNIGNQADGVAVTYFQNEAPYLATTGVPSNSGDVWYDTNASTPTAYKFVYKTLGADGVTVITPSTWTSITNVFVLSSLESASKTKASADRSIKNYTNTPVIPYYEGDTWMQGSTGDIYVCDVERLTGAFNQSDWIIASKYTDNSRVIQLETGIANGSVAFNLDNATIDGSTLLSEYIAAEIDKEVVVYSGTNHLDYSSLGSLKPNDLYIEKTTAAGASGVAVDVLNTWKCLTVTPSTGAVTLATWIQIGNNNNITALADLADGKRTVFSGNTVPTGAVARDIWIPSSANGSYLQGEIYQYNGTSWVIATKYSSDIAALSSSVQTQIDSKVDTYYQASVPFANATNVAKRATAGDYWYCTQDVGIYLKGKIYKYLESANGSNYNYTWTLTTDISRDAFDLADGKSTIYTTASQPTKYNMNDMMIVVSSFNNGTTTFSDGVVLTATVDSNSFVASHWVKKINDTEDLDAYKDVVDPQLISLQNQVDGKIESWYAVSTSDPKTAWTDAPTRAKHDGDMWYQTNTKLSYYYSSGTNSWNLIDDAKAILALSNAATAQATADGVVVSYYAIKQDTAPATSNLWVNKTGTKVLKKYTASWVNVTVKQGDTLTAYDPVTKDISVYVYNGTGWITNTENGVVASAEAITELNADLTSLGTTVGGHTTQLSTVDARIANGVASVDSKWTYNSNLIIGGVSYNSGFGLISTFTGTPNPSNPPIGTSEFWINADKLKLTTTGYTGTKYSPFTVNGTTGEITFNGKVSFTNTTGVPDFATSSELDTVSNSVTALSNSLSSLADSVEAQDGLISTFYSTTTPLAPSMKFGDYWLDTDSAGYVVYRYQGASGLNNTPLAWVASYSATAKSLQNAYAAQKVADGKVNTYYQTAAPTGVLVVGDIWIDTDDNYKQYRWSGSAWVVIAYNPATAVNSGTTTINGPKITTGSITAAQIAAGTITADKISTYNLTASNAKIQNGMISNAMIANASITNAKIADASITNAKITDASITSAKIVDLSVSTLKIQDEAVIVPRYASGNGSVTIYYTPSVNHTVYFMIDVPTVYGNIRLVLYVNGVAYYNYYSNSGFSVSNYSGSTPVSLSAGVNYTFTITAVTRAESQDIPLFTQLLMLGIKK